MLMKRISLILTIALAFSLLLLAATPQPKPADSGNLEAVLKKMDAVSTSFRTTQVEFEWDTYEKVIDEVDEVQTGTIYYPNSGKEIEMMAEVKKAGSDLTKLKPEPKYVLFSKGKVRMYQPKPDQVTEFDIDRKSTRLNSSHLG